MVCKILNFDKLTAKHLTQASCTELTLRIRQSGYRLSWMSGYDFVTLKLWCQPPQFHEVFLDLWIFIVYSVDMKFSKLSFQIRLFLKLMNLKLQRSQGSLSLLCFKVKYNGMGIFLKSNSIFFSNLPFHRIFWIRYFNLV